MMKSLAVFAVLLGGGAYFTGALGPSLTHTRTVGRPQATVMAALDTLDIREAPGSPGTDAGASGGVQPVFQLERDANEMRWKVMSGDKVATTMIADFKPSDDGKDTAVTLHVERGDAPDDFVSPAFRSKGITLGLFSVVVEDKLNRLVDPPAAADPKTCDDLDDRFRAANEAADAQKATGLTAAIAKTAGISMRLNAYAAERRRLGCGEMSFRPSGDDTFQPISNKLAPAGG